MLASRYKRVMSPAARTHVARLCSSRPVAALLPPPAFRLSARRALYLNTLTLVVSSLRTRVRVRTVRAALT